MFQEHPSPCAYINLLINRLAIISVIDYGKTGLCWRVKGRGKTWGLRMFLTEERPFGDWPSFSGDLPWGCSECSAWPHTYAGNNRNLSTLSGSEPVGVDVTWLTLAFHSKQSGWPGKISTKGKKPFIPALNGNEDKAKSPIIITEHFILKSLSTSYWLGSV